ncbi:MAG TPA: hypothetical protein VMR31_18190 [Myxococcota bacterium]|nr:hypothetical protein [Myxococcota bacterium]
MRRHRKLALLVSVLCAACATYASIEPTFADVGPLLDCSLDVRDTLARRFDDYRLHPDREVMLTGEAGASQVQVASHDFFVSSLDAQTHWSTRASVFLYSSPERAESAFRDHCRVYADGYPKDVLRTSESEDRRACLTPLGLLHDDSAWVQSAVVQRGPIVISLLETRRGSARDATPFAEVVADVAQRICRQDRPKAKKSHARRGP